jgi:transposase
VLTDGIDIVEAACQEALDQNVCSAAVIINILARRRDPAPAVNLGSHKGKAVRRAIQSAGARLFLLPKYSPDLNPIEKLFAKLKHWLRKAAKRTVETVYDAIGQILEIVTPTECRNYFTEAGYRQAKFIPL